ncbi:hypothetical protein [Mycobacterium sp. 94-17]|uniref:hypothetical protein n=1 Tax=Mycobacterium sp. 94-17 TaxID=2986147 RepID=UPI002D1F7782|nr:hypothetical protein [Mycobacterium sp. 94-17]MEB4207840.1 hypothetical protein [Mycobacterium sp. 94-17]
MADESDQSNRGFEGLPVVGGLLRRQRREAERAISGVIDSIMRDSIGIDLIVQRLNLDAVVARLDIGEIVARLDIDKIVSRLDISAIVARLDIDAIVARLDVDAIVAQLDIDAIVARLDMNDVVARIDFAKLTDQMVGDIDFPKVIRQAGNSVVRGHRVRKKAPDVSP